MEFRLDEIQRQGKIIPLDDEFMQLLKSPAGEFYNHICSVFIPMRFTAIIGNLPILVHPLFRQQQFLFERQVAQVITVRYDLVQPENHIHEAPGIKS